MGFNDYCAAHLNQYAELELLFSRNGDAIGFNESFRAGRNSFNEGLRKCYEYRDTANGSTKGFTKTKNDCKRISSISASSVSGKGRSYAITIRDTELEEKMSRWTKRFLWKSNDGDFAGLVQNIYDELVAFTESDAELSADYFTAEELENMVNDMDDYTKKLNLYKNAMSEINTAKKDFKKKQIPIMEEHIRFLEGFLIDLEVVHPDFVKQFKKIVAKIIKARKRNQGVSAEMVDDETGVAIVLKGELKMVNYTVGKKPKESFTNNMGGIPLLKLKAGSWDGVFSAKGYEDVHIVIKVEPRKVTILKVRMMRV